MNVASSKNDICEKFITPVIIKSGWSRESQISFCGDIDFAYKQLDTEYVLYYKPNIPVAVISVTEKDTDIDVGIEKAIHNAKYLDIPCAFSSNGSSFVFYDRTKLQEVAKKELSINQFPHPNELWDIYLNYKNISAATSEIQSAIDNGFTRLLIGVLGIGGCVISIIFKILDNLFTSKVDKRILYLTDQEDYWRRKEWDYLNNQLNQRQPRNENNQRDNNSQNAIPIDYIQLQTNDMKIYHSSVDNFGNEYIRNNKKLSSDFFDIIFLDMQGNSYIGDAKCQDILKYFNDIPQIAIKLKDEILESDRTYFGQPIYVDVTDQSVSNSDAPHVTRIEENENHASSSNQPITNITTSNQTYSIVNEYNTNYNNTIVSKNVFNNKITINTTIMARQTSFSHQIELAEDLKAYLLRLQDNLGNAAQKYINKSNSLYEAGMMDEKHQVLEEYVFETVNRIKSIVEQINEADIPFVEKYIKYLEDSNFIR